MCIHCGVLICIDCSRATTVIDTIEKCPVCSQQGQWCCRAPVAVRRMCAGFSCAFCDQCSPEDCPLKREPCDACGTTIRRCDYQRHRHTTCTTPVMPPSQVIIACDGCGMQIPAVDAEHHSLACPAAGPDPSDVLIHGEALNHEGPPSPPFNDVFVVDESDAEDPDVEDPDWLPVFNA